MKLKKLLKSTLVATMFCASLSVFATNTYQVTGPILELTDTKIVVKKGKDKWEIARDATTKIEGDLKVGSKVTIMYTMSAASVEVKKK